MKKLSEDEPPCDGYFTFSILHRIKNLTARSLQIWCEDRLIQPAMFGNWRVFTVEAAREMALLQALRDRGVASEASARTERAATGKWLARPFARAVLRLVRAHVKGSGWTGFLLYTDRLRIVARENVMREALSAAGPVGFCIDLADVGRMFGIDDEEYLRSGEMREVRAALRRRQSAKMWAA